MALDKHEYIEKMELLLADSNTYENLRRNPVNKIITKLKLLLKSWKYYGYLSDCSYNNLNCTTPILPLAYGLPKILKVGCPLRIIVSSVGSPLHNLGSFLYKIISKSLPPANSSIVNSYFLMKKVSNLTIPAKASLLSLDVISLFTNVPIDLILDGISNRWFLIENNTNISKTEFFRTLKLVVNFTFFMFN